jgi:putative intracellular protease/amidase
VIFGQLGAARDALDCYSSLQADSGFRAPQSWQALVATDFDALVLPGGHAPGMRQYLGSRQLGSLVTDFVATGRPFGAICHGPVVLARATDAESGRSLLHGRRTTCLPKSMERSAYALTAWKLGRYYRTYPTYVADEIRAALARPVDLINGPRSLGLRRGTDDDDGPTFVVEDGAYVSARWPGDSWAFAKALLARL